MDHPGDEDAALAVYNAALALNEAALNALLLDEDFLIPDEEGDPEGDPEDDPEGDPERGHPVADAAPQIRLRRGVRNDAFEREAKGLVPTDGVAWADARHPLWTPRLLTVDDPRAPNPANFKGDLFPPQKALLAAMQATECKPFAKVEDARCAEEWAPILQTRVGRLAAQPAFGKTVLSLALVCSQRVPVRLPDQQPLMTYPVVGAGHRCGNRANIIVTRGGGTYDPVGVGFIPEVAVRYSRYLPLTIVAASANVISQWESETRRFTELRYFIIENVRSMHKFQELYHRGEAANLDLVFVKAGRVTTSFVVKGEPPHQGKSKNRSLFEALARVLEGVPVARLIIDDYDTLKLGSDDCFVPALFTWLVSATRRQTTARATIRTDYATIEDFFRANLMTSFPILGVALDDIINKVFSLQCAPEFVDAHINSTKIEFRRIYVRGGQFVAILRDLDVTEDIIEMVNADAVGTAAQSLGIVAQTIGDVVHRVVGIHLDKLRNAVQVLGRTAQARESLAGRQSFHENNLDLVKELRATIKDGSDDEFATALAGFAGLSPEASAALKSLETWAEEQCDKHGKTLNRMRDNIREGRCQCCMLPFEKGDDAEPAYILAGCCQIIVCETCITRKLGTNKKAFIRRCPHCLHDIKIKTGLIRVGAELDLEAALNDEIVINADPDDSLEIKPAATIAEGPAIDLLDTFNNPKLKALIQLIRAEIRMGVVGADGVDGVVGAIDCIRDVRTPPYVEGLLDGRQDIPWARGQPRKFLIFTMHAESTRLIANTCEALAIPFSILRGVRAQKDEAVRALREEADVMLVTSAKDCGGLNLPFVSHIVFYHHILDRNVEVQVAARGQRLGRKGNLEIITLINEAEAERLPG